MDKAHPHEITTRDDGAGIPTRRHQRCDATVPLHSYPGPALAFGRRSVDDREHDGPATCRPVSSGDDSIAAAAE
jgi:hypothetical protein